MDRSPSRFELSTRAYLLLLVTGIVLPGVVFAAVVLWRFIELERTQYRADAAHAAERIAAAVDREFSEFESALQALTTGRSFNERAFDRFYERAVEVKRILDADVILKNEDGQHLINTRVPYGVALPTSLQPHERRALALRRAQVSDLFVATFSQAPTISITLPLARPQATTLLLTIAVAPRRFLDVLEAQALPANWTATVIDRAGAIVARSRDHDLYLGRTVTLAGERSSATWESVGVDGKPALFASSQPQLSEGWRVVVNVPREAVDAPLYRAVIPLALGGVLALLLSLAAAIWFGTRAGRAMKQLADSAAAVGSSRPAAPLTTPVREINLVGSALAGASRDLAAREMERRQAEAALTRLNESLEAAIEERSAQLVQLQKLESIGQLTGGVAHDFNNLLMAILGSLELLKKRLHGDPRAERLLENAMQGARRGATLTQRLLAFARRQELALTAVDVGALVQGMSDLLRRSLGPKVHLIFDVPDDLPAANADANQLELAVLNLAVNGRDAMPAGGRLTISGRAAVVGEDDRQGVAPGDYVVLTITDTGCGMDEETLRRAAEPFFTTKGVGRGTGLGLSMVHGLAQQSGGRLVLSSREGDGTIAELWLPKSARTAEADVRSPPPARAGELASHRILLVDDDPLVIASTASLLDDLGQRVVEATSGQRALEILREATPVDVLITDYAMPGMTGLELIEAARRLRSDLPTILATGYAEAPDDPGAYDVRIGKPFKQAGLQAAIRQALDAGASREMREPLSA